MIIAEVKGDLVKMLQSAIERNVPFIAAQGCNMQGIQGSGIAGQLRVIPEIYEADLQAYNNGNAIPDCPSVAHFNFFGSNRWQLFFNLYTQPTPGPTARYDYLNKALLAMNEYLRDLGRGDEVVFIPQIGCGIGGLDWKEVEYMLEDEPTNFIIVHYDGGE